MVKRIGNVCLGEDITKKEKRSCGPVDKYLEAAVTGERDDTCFNSLEVRENGTLAREKMRLTVINRRKTHVNCI